LTDTAASDLASAGKHFRRAVSLAPSDYRTHAYLASNQLNQKQTAEARASFKRVLELNPGNQVAHYNLGVIALLESKPAEALPHFQAVHRANPRDTAVLIGLLEAEVLLRKPVGATVQKIERLTTGAAPERQQAAVVLIAGEQYEAAIPLLRGIRDSNPGSFDAAYNLALACFRAGKLDEASAALQPLLGGRRAGEAYRLLGAVQERAGSPEALRSFAEAVRLDPSEDSRVDYASALVMAGDFDKAIAIFADAQKAFPRSQRVRLGLGSAQYLAGLYPEAAETLLAAVRAQPASAAAYDLLGRTYESVPARQEEIKQLFAEYLRRNPRDAAAYTHYATMTGDKQYLHRALEINPRFAAAHFQLGAMAQRDDDLPTAAAAFERAAALEPNYATAHYRLGTVLQKMGKTQQAQAEFALFRKLRAEEGKQERQSVMRSLGDR
jgi:tetratricopeptide (TPR) repeat protein